MASDICDFFNGRSVFITGATGFMGKVLVEKLLRSCPNVKNLFLLLRPKKGDDIHTRLEEIINTKIFDGLRNDSPQVFQKLIPIAGDISVAGLGLSNDDLESLRANVSIVFHSAARVKFDDAFTMNLDMNVKGTMRVMDLCLQLQHLEVVIHVSSAYSNCDKSDVSEIIYSTSVDPIKLMDCIDTMDEDLIKGVVKPLIGKYPNTYNFTKGLTEYVLKKEYSQLPIVIVRPTTVTAAMKEPIPGWIDNLNGPTGVIVGIGKGLLSSVYCREELITDLIPVDFPINLMIAAAWYRGTHKSTDIEVYNCATGIENPLTWGQLRSYGMKSAEKYPFLITLRSPSFKFHRNMFVHKIVVIFYHYLPAYIIDFVTGLFGKSMKLVTLYAKAHRALQVLDFFSVNEWRFSSENSVKLANKMSIQDRSEFYFDVNEIDWPSYLDTFVLGVRHFLIKDSPDSIPEARKRSKRMYWVQTIVTVFLILVLSYLVVRLVSSLFQ